MTAATVEQHYTRHDLLGAIREGLERAGKDLTQLTRDTCSGAAWSRSWPTTGGRQDPDADCPPASPLRALCEPRPCTGPPRLRGAAMRPQGARLERREGHWHVCVLRGAEGAVDAVWLSLGGCPARSSPPCASGWLSWARRRVGERQPQGPQARPAASPRGRHVQLYE